MSQPKKIKIDYSDINLDDYMDINLKEYRNYIYTQIDDLQSQINSFNNILYKIDKCVHKKCEKKNVIVLPIHLVAIMISIIINLKQ